MVKFVLAMLAAVWLFCGSAPAWAAEPTTQPTSAPKSQPAVTPQRIAVLVAQLGDESATKREQASKALAEIGPPALPELRKALDSGDIEIVARATILQKTIRRAATDESLLWKIELPDGGNNSWPVVTDDLVIFHGGDGDVHAITRTDGKQKWTHKYKTYDDTMCAMCHKPNMALLGDKLICLGTWEIGPGPMALDAASGKVLWQSEDHYFDTIAKDNAIVSVTRDDEILRLSPEDGTVVWRVKKSELVGSPYVGAYSLQIAEDVCLIPNSHGESINAEKSRSLVAVELATGKKMWSIDGHCYIDSIHEGRVYVSWWETYKNVFRVFDLKTGTEQEAKLSAADIRGCSKEVGEYLLSNLWYSASLKAHDVASGKLVWQYAPRGVGEVLTEWVGITYASYSDHRFPVAMYDGAALLIVDDGLLAVDIKTGKPRWKFSMECTNLYGLVVRDGVAYFMDDGHPIVDQRKRDHHGPAHKVPKHKRYLYALDLAKASQLDVPPEYEPAEVTEK